MMRSLTVIMLTACVIESCSSELGGAEHSMDAMANELADNVVATLFTTDEEDVNDLMLGKPGHRAAPKVELKVPRPLPKGISEVNEDWSVGLKGSARAMASVALAGLLALAPVQEADAARSGGRIGGRSGFASRSMRTAMPRAGPSTNVFVAPRLSIGGGFGSFGLGYGGYGYSPFGGGMSTGTYLGLSLVETLLREQQRQAYLQQQLRTQEQLGQDQAMIQQLRSELQAQDAKVEGLKAQQTTSSGGDVSDAEKIRLLEQQLAEQQKQIDALKENPKSQLN